MRGRLSTRPLQAAARRAPHLGPTCAVVSDADDFAEASAARARDRVVVLAFAGGLRNTVRVANPARRAPRPRHPLRRARAGARRPDAVKDARPGAPASWCRCAPLVRPGRGRQPRPQQRIDWRGTGGRSGDRARDRRSGLDIEQRLATRRGTSPVRPAARVSLTRRGLRPSATLPCSFRGRLCGDGPRSLRVAPADAEASLIASGPRSAARWPGSSATRRGQRRRRGPPRAQAGPRAGRCGGRRAGARAPGRRRHWPGEEAPRRRRDGQSRR